METRSKRQQNSAQRPPYPQISTATMTAPSQSSASSAFQSSSSLASVQSPGSTGFMVMQSPIAYGQQHQYTQSSAPLPSPLAQQQSNYFGSLGASTTHQASLAQQRNPQAGQTYTGQRGGNGGAPETAPFLNNFNLVAEAAKRAQMACLMRDLGDVEL